MVRGDTLYAGCINAGDLYIIDVSDKNNPIVLLTVKLQMLLHNACKDDASMYLLQMKNRFI